MICVFFNNGTEIEKVTDVMRTDNFNGSYCSREVVFYPNREAMLEELANGELCLEKSDFLDKDYLTFIENGEVFRITAESQFTITKV